MHRADERKLLSTLGAFFGAPLKKRGPKRAAPKALKNMTMRFGFPMDFGSH